MQQTFPRFHKVNASEHESQNPPTLREIEHAIRVCARKVVKIHHEQRVWEIPQPLNEAVMHLEEALNRLQAARLSHD